MSAPVQVMVLDLAAVVPYYTAHLCAALRRCPGVETRLASITYQYDPECFRRFGVCNRPGLLDLTWRLRRLPASLRRALKLAECLINMTALWIRFALARPDILHVQFLALTGNRIPGEALWLRAVRALGIRVVYTVHNVLPQDPRPGDRANYRRVYGLADRFVCHDDTAARRMTTEFGVGAARISVIPHGPLFEPRGAANVAEARQRLGFVEDDCVVLWQGIVRPYKGLSFLLQAWKRLCAEPHRGSLAIVGTGAPEMLRAVEEEVSELALASTVRLELRFVSLAELAAWHAAADVLVYPYREITTSGALLTGIVWGKAVVATRLPAFERLLNDGESALLVPCGDVDALARSLRRVIEEPLLRRELGARLALRQSAIPRWREIAERTHEAYASVVCESPGFTSQAAST
ncbi:MAG: glycosyltransferase [Acidobacteria bacterium]|nr:glycosyltransferase [Acidobacteriota bacterium]